MHVARWMAEDGQHTVLAAEGRKYWHIVMNDFPIKHVRLPKSEGRYLHELDYPVPKAVRMFRRFARKAGITRAAAKMLKENA